MLLFCSKSFISAERQVAEEYKKHVQKKLGQKTDKGIEHQWKSRQMHGLHSTHITLKYIHDAPSFIQLNGMYYFHVLENIKNEGKTKRKEMSSFNIKKFSYFVFISYFVIILFIFMCH